MENMCESSQFEKITNNEQLLSTMIKLSKMFTDQFFQIDYAENSKLNDTFDKFQEQFQQLSLHERETIYEKLKSETEKHQNGCLICMRNTNTDWKFCNIYHENTSIIHEITNFISDD